MSVLDTVALNRRVLTPSELETFSLPGGRLVLIIPLQTARLLTPPQIRSALHLVENDAILVSEGITPLTRQLGFNSGKNIMVKRLEELAFPTVEITWEKEERVTFLQIPPGTIVLNRERDSKAPMVCLLPYGRGNCLLLAAELDPDKGEGYARFPYFLHELHRAGLNFPFRSERLSALFDYAYRYKENPETLADNWSSIGIQALHVGAWDFFNTDDVADSFLNKLIDACHRHGILVYAWLELPHVSEEFWKKHPEWREKTATGRDALIDWRLVMNLKNPDCFNAVAAGMERLFRRFDWDGANLAELYFDSPSGAEEPDDFTPLNPTVRSEFKLLAGIDPIDYFNKSSRYYWKKNPDAWKKFIDYRISEEKNLNERFIRLLSGFRSSFKPFLDVTVTYVDNIYDPSMREAVGADVSLMFNLLERYDFTLIMEDPGTVWHLGPHRYAELAATYSKMSRHADQLGIDINIINRDQETYPTRKQTGSEFLELFYQAGCHFETVMVYAEQTMLPQDAELVSHTLSRNSLVEKVPQGVRIISAIPVVYRSGIKNVIFDVDGVPWPCADQGDVRLPAGSHIVSTGSGVSYKSPRLIKLNGNLTGARYSGDRSVEFSYSARRRAIALFSDIPKLLELDGGRFAAPQGDWVMLPGGSHKVRVDF